MCFFAASATASSGETASSGDKTLRLDRGSAIQTMDVHKTSSGYCIPMNIFERLFESKLNDNGRTEQPVLRPCGDRMAARHRAGELDCDRKTAQQNRWREICMMCEGKWNASGFSCFSAPRHFIAQRKRET